MAGWSRAHCEGCAYDIASHRCGIPCVEALLGSELVQLVGVVIAGPRRLSISSSLRRKLRKTLRVGVLGVLNGLRLRRWYAEEDTLDVRIVCGEAGVPCVEALHLDAAPVLEFLRRTKPDLGCSVNNGYIPRSVFSLPRFGMINVHGELLPAYQNAQSVIWSIYNRECVTGLTIHQVNERIDAGPILYQERCAIDFGRTLRETVTRTVQKVRQRVPPALRQVCENYEALLESAVPQISGTSYTTPSLEAFIRMVANNRKMSTGRK